MKNVILSCFLAIISNIAFSQNYTIGPKCDSLIAQHTLSGMYGQMVITPSNEIVVVGYDSMGGNNSDIILRKYDANLGLIWSKTFLSGGNQDYALGLISTSDGGYLIHRAVSMTDANGYYSVGYIIKTDALGNQQWSQRLNGQSSGDNYSSTVVENSQGEFICYGHVQFHGGCAGFGSLQYSTRLTKLSSSGNILWSECFDTNPDWIGGFDKLKTSNEYIGAYDVSSSVVLYKWDDNGMPLNSFTYSHGIYSTTSLCIRACSSGGFYLGGFIDSAGVRKALITKFDSNFNILWEKTFAQSQVCAFFEITETQNGIVYACGTGMTAGDLNGFVVNLYSNGTTISQKQYGYSNSYDAFYGIGVLNNNDVVTSGITSYYVDNDAFLVKFGEISPLPVSLTEFKLYCSEENVILHWSTASEINNDYFLVEKSEDGNEYISVGTITGHGNSSFLIDYQFIDNAANGKEYYRLKQYDYDGKMTIYGPIINDCKTSLFEIQCFPNPFTENITVRTGFEKFDVEIYNVAGQLVKSVKSNSGSVLINTPFENGVYILCLVHDGIKENVKIVK